MRFGTNRKEAESMILKIGIAVAVVGVAVAAYFAYRILGPGPAAANPAPPNSKFYDFTMKDIDGRDVPMASFKGDVLMVVNTASRCGFTPQYEALQAVYGKYKDRGFKVLGFPANNFMGQEPGSNEEIKDFCTTRFKVSFPMFSKISVKGEDQHPLYNFLTTQSPFPGAVSWNFNKFIIDRDGNVVARFGSGDKPDDAKVIAAIEKALGNQ
jgi:glutathione peroxidase